MPEARPPWEVMPVPAAEVRGDDCRNSVEFRVDQRLHRIEGVLVNYDRANVPGFQNPPLGGCRQENLPTPDLIERVSPPSRNGENPRRNRLNFEICRPRSHGFARMFADQAFRPDQQSFPRLGLSLCKSLVERFRIGRFGFSDDGYSGFIHCAFPFSNSARLNETL